MLAFIVIGLLAAITPFPYNVGLLYVYYLFFLAD
jgi:hypothetical protein